MQREAQTWNYAYVSCFLYISNQNTSFMQLQSQATVIFTLHKTNCLKPVCLVEALSQTNHCGLTSCSWYYTVLDLQKFRFVKFQNLNFVLCVAKRNYFLWKNKVTVLRGKTAVERASGCDCQVPNSTVENSRHSGATGVLAVQSLEGLLQLCD
jgi:hypothetical protein